MCASRATCSHAQPRLEILENIDTFAYIVALKIYTYRCKLLSFNR